MRRGSLVTITLQGDFGKPRPALVIQSDLFNETHSTVTVLPMTSAIIDTPIFRIGVEPSKSNGLHQAWQITIDKTVTVRREKIGAVIGHIDDKTLLQVNRSLAVFIGIA